MIPNFDEEQALTRKPLICGTCRKNPAYCAGWCRDCYNFREGLMRDERLKLADDLIAYATDTEDILGLWVAERIRREEEAWALNEVLKGPPALMPAGFALWKRRTRPE